MDMLYRYRARDLAGKEATGEIEADNLEALREAVKSQGLYLVNAETTQVKAATGRRSRKKLKDKDLAVFCKQMAAMLNSGVTLIHSLDILYQQSEKPSEKAYMRSIYEEVQKGGMFSDALRKQGGVFPPLMVAMVEAGEASGTLEKIMDRLSIQYESDAKLGNKIRGAMIYPAVVGTIAIFAAVGLIVFVLPTFMTMFESTDVLLPAPTRMLIWMSDGMRGYWYIIVPVVVGTVVGVKTYFNSPSGVLVKDRYKLKLPIIKSTSIKIYAARFSRAMSSLVSSGIPLLNSLDITSRVVNNSVVMKKLEDVQDDVRAGSLLGASLKKYALFPPIVFLMISIGEESGNLDEMFNKTSDYLDEEVNTSISNLMSMIEPLMMVVVAILVGFIVISMLLPIFSLHDAIS